MQYRKAFQLRDGDSWISTIGLELDLGLQVTLSVPLHLMPNPVSVDELRRRGLLEWLAVIE